MFAMISKQQGRMCMADAPQEWIASLSNASVPCCKCIKKSSPVRNLQHELSLTFQLGRAYQKLLAAVWRASLSLLRTEKAHKLFQHQLFGPHPKPPFWAPRKKLMCLISWERTPKKTHTNFSGGFGGSKTGSQTGHFRSQKVKFIVFFPALILTEGSRFP